MLEFAREAGEPFRLEVPAVEPPAEEGGLPVLLVLGAGIGGVGLLGAVGGGATKELCDTCHGYDSDDDDAALKYT